MEGRDGGFLAAPKAARTPPDVVRPRKLASLEVGVPALPRQQPIPRQDTKEGASAIPPELSDSPFVVRTAQTFPRPVRAVGVTFSPALARQGLVVGRIGRTVAPALGGTGQP